MTIEELARRMIAFSKGHPEDVAHFLKVWSYARIIAKEEGLDREGQFLTEAGALVHDIAVPLCREKYGNANGRNQEKEGGPLVLSFLEGTDLTKEQRERLAFLVAHHHTYRGIEGLDYQILVEADYLVNAQESHYSKRSIRLFEEKVFATQTGREILEDLFLRGEEETEDTKEIKETKEKEETEEKDLMDALEEVSFLGRRALEGKETGEAYVEALKGLEALVRSSSVNRIYTYCFPENIENSLIADQALLDHLPEEGDRLSLLSTLATYYGCKEEGLPEHSRIYMDRVSSLRGIIDEVEGRKSQRFCGS